MFARHATRAAQPLRHSVRKYATEAAPAKGPNVFLWVGAAAVAGGAGYYYATQGGGAAPAARKPSGAKTFTGGDQGFIDLKVTKVEQLSDNTKRLRFALPNPDDVSGLKIASALLSKVHRPGDEKPTMRPYTPVSDEDALGYIDLVVKRYPNGPMSEHIHALQPDDTLSLKGPLPKYPLAENQHNHVALITGGTGITPMYQLLRAIFKNPDDKTKVTLVYGSVTEEDILLRKELQELENNFPQRFRAFYLLDKPSENWKGGKGYITKDLLKTVLPEPKEDNIKLFVCGPPGLYKAVSGPKNSPKDQGELSGILKELGYAKDQVYKF